MPKNKKKKRVADNKDANDTENENEIAKNTDDKAKEGSSEVEIKQEKDSSSLEDPYYNRYLFGDTLNIEKARQSTTVLN